MRPVLLCCVKRPCLNRKVFSFYLILTKPLPLWNFNLASFFLLNPPSPHGISSDLLWGRCGYFLVLFYFSFISINLRNDICTFSHILSAASGFQTGIKRKREEEDDGDLNIDGDDSEEYGKPQYPIKLVYFSVILVGLSVKLVYLSVKRVYLC